MKKENLNSVEIISSWMSFHSYEYEYIIMDMENLISVSWFENIKHEKVV